MADGMTGTEEATRPAPGGATGAGVDRLATWPGPREANGGASPGGARGPRPDAARGSPADPLVAVVRVLGAAVLLELTLLRTFYRVGLFLPREGPFRTVYALLTGLGSFAFNLASVLAYLAVGWLAVRSFRAGRRGVAAALSAFGAASLLSTAAGGSPGATMRPLFAAAALAAAWPALRPVRARWDATARRTGDRIAPRALGRLAVGAVVAAMLSSAYASLGASSGGAPGEVAVQLVGEALVVAGAFLLAATWVTEGAPGLGAGLVVGALAGAGFLAGWWAAPAVTGILVLWTVGLRLFLPVPLYAAALAGYAAAGAGWWRGGSLRGPALSILIAAGVALDSTYGQVLALLGLALLAEGPAADGP